jgi:LmbE family N-acetylglucosaminyl deacetylase
MSVTAPTDAAAANVDAVAANVDAVAANVDAVAANVDAAAVGADVEAPPLFVVDDGNLGRSEAAWAASPYLAGLADLELPTVTDVVVIAPHPDDEILGSGGLLQVLSHAGADVEVLAVTDGEGSHPNVPSRDLRRVRTDESTTALLRLGLAGATRRRLGMPDGGITGREAELIDALSSRLRPSSLCLAPWHADGHPDHDACGRAALAAAAATGARLLEYPIWAWHWADPAGHDLPWAACRRLALDRRTSARKRWATSAFHSQIRPYGPPPSGSAIVPAPVLRRFWRPFEVYIT